MKKKLIRFFTRQSISYTQKAEKNLSVANDIEGNDVYTYISVVTLIILFIASLAGLAFVFTWSGLTVLQLFAGVLCWFFVMFILRVVVILLS